MSTVISEPVAQKPVVAFSADRNAFITKMLASQDFNAATSYAIRTLDSVSPLPDQIYNTILQNILNGKLITMSSEKLLLAKSLILKCLEKGVPVNSELAEKTVIGLRDFDPMSSYNLLQLLLEKDCRVKTETIEVSVVSLRESHPLESVNLALKALEKNYKLNPETVEISLGKLYQMDIASTEGHLQRALELGITPRPAFVEFVIISLDQAGKIQESSALLSKVLDNENVSLKLKTIEIVIMKTRETSLEAACGLSIKSLDRGYILKRAVIENTAVLLRERSPEQTALLLLKALSKENYKFNEQTIEITCKHLIRDGKQELAGNLLYEVIDKDGYSIDGALVQDVILSLMDSNLQDLACKLTSKTLRCGYHISF